jgi:predicted aldo/keto reductase-like oxidoreductase
VSALSAGAVASAEVVQAQERGDASSIPLRPLGKTGKLVSIVGFGGGSRYMQQKDEETAEKMIHRAVELGINYFDTAHGYQQDGERLSHIRYGKYLVPNYRRQITLVSKLSARDAEGAKRQFEETMKELNADHLDILHFHALGSKEDIDQILAADGALKAYQQWKDEGVIKYIGCTGHADSTVILDAMKRIQPDVVMCPQNPAHAEDRRGYTGINFSRDVLPYGLEHGIGLVAMKTTAQNHLIGKGDIPVEKLIEYALNLPVAAAVIGMPSLEVVESNARIARSLKPMTQEEREEIRKQVAYAGGHQRLPYRVAGYQDGVFIA